MKKILFTLLAVATFGAASSPVLGYAREGHWAADVAADADGNVLLPVIPGMTLIFLPITTTM